MLFGYGTEPQQVSGCKSLARVERSRARLWDVNALFLPSRVWLYELYQVRSFYLRSLSVQRNWVDITAFVFSKQMALCKLLYGAVRPFLSYTLFIR